jgi:hypothetical protein
MAASTFQRLWRNRHFDTDGPMAHGGADRQNQQHRATQGLTADAVPMADQLNRCS